MLTILISQLLLIVQLTGLIMVDMAISDHEANATVLWLFIISFSIVHYIAYMYLWVPLELKVTLIQAFLAPLLYIPSIIGIYFLLEYVYSASYWQ